MTLDSLPRFEFGRLRLSSQVLQQDLDGESVLLDLRTETYFGLNDVGTRILSLLKESGDVTRVYEKILLEFEVEPLRAEADLRALICKLLEAGLLEADVA